ncbi:hypothetical protein [Fodinicola acaciae]|uniref:hypothetical protein n=1 Tax=Fodinicola acaciae TaxID=2681555 RepID=UPI0013D0018A|nr:hypothetical protein [Fodinicola acaciae]
MTDKKGRLLRVTSVLAMAAALIIGLVSPAAAASGDYGSKIFYPDNTNVDLTDNNGRFTAQVSYQANGQQELPVAFSFTMSSALQAAGTGHMSCTIDQFANGTHDAHDHHGDIPLDYRWHWTFPRNPIGTNEQANGGCTFNARSGGTIFVKVVFRYVVDGGSE